MKRADELNIEDIEQIRDVISCGTCPTTRRYHCGHCPITYDEATCPGRKVIIYRCHQLLEELDRIIERTIL